MVCVYRSIQIGVPDRKDLKQRKEVPVTSVQKKRRKTLSFFLFINVVR